MKYKTIVLLRKHKKKVIIILIALAFMIPCLCVLLLSPNRTYSQEQKKFSTNDNQFEIQTNSFGFFFIDCSMQLIGDDYKFQLTYELEEPNLSKEEIKIQAYLLDGTELHQIVSSWDTTKITIELTKKYSQQVIIKLISTINSKMKAYIHIDSIRMIKNINKLVCKSEKMEDLYAQCSSLDINSPYHLDVTYETEFSKITSFKAEVQNFEFEFDTTYYMNKSIIKIEDKKILEDLMAKNMNFGNHSVPKIIDMLREIPSLNKQNFFKTYQNHNGLRFYISFDIKIVETRQLFHLKNVPWIFVLDQYYTEKEIQMLL